MGRPGSRGARRRRAAAAAVGLAVLAGGCARVRSSPAVPFPSGSGGPLVEAARAAVASTGVERAAWGVAVRSLERGDTLLEWNADVLMVPASALKLVTLGAAAEAVGWDYAFDTMLVSRGAVVDGVLDGDLVVHGTGDPTIGGRGGGDFAGWVESVRGRGIERVTGRIVGNDDGAEEPLPRFAWAWDDLGYAYGALPGALNFGENRARVTIEPGPQPGTPAVLSLARGLDSVRVANEVETVAAGSTPVVRPMLDPAGHGLRIRGVVPAGGSPLTFPVSAGNPTLAFASMLRHRLVESGVAVDGAPVDIDDAVPAAANGPTAVLHRHRSPPLSAIAEPMLKESLNLYAETVLWLATGPEGPRAADPALDAVRDRLAAWGVAGPHHQIVDGSGLSRRNTITAAALVAVLERFHDPLWTSPWMRALPVAGRDGTLESRLGGTPAEGNLAAKTGSMSNIRSLAGYVRTRDGETLAFAVIVNNFEGSGRDAEAAIDRVAAALAGFSRNGR